MIDAVFFDLDGTLIDSAPDLVFAINQVLINEGKPSLPFSQLGPFVSGGSPALLKIAFNILPADPDFNRLKQCFLNIYAENLCNKSQLYPGISSLLNLLDQNKIPWGIVTNKPEFLTVPLLKQFELYDRACVVISGDTYAQKKPDPYPLIQACKLSRILPERALYIGDDERDIISARAANMVSVCALWGYDSNKNPKDWMARYYIEDSQKLASFVVKQLNLQSDDTVSTTNVRLSR